MMEGSVPPAAGDSREPASTGTVPLERPPEGDRHQTSRIRHLVTRAWRYSTPDDLEVDERDRLRRAMRAQLAAEPEHVDDRLLTVEARVLAPMKWMNHYAAQSRWRHSALRLAGVLAGSVTP